MTYRIQKTIKISAAHHLPFVPEGHQCGRNHGHNYVIVIDANCADVYLTDGFVVDFGELSAVVKSLDHRDLNDFLENPTAELVAKEIYGLLHEKWPRVDFPRVRVHETEDSWAEYLRD